MPSAITKEKIVLSLFGIFLIFYVIVPVMEARPHYNDQRIIKSSEMFMSRQGHKQDRREMNDQSTRTL